MNLIIEIPSLPPPQASPNWRPFTAGAYYVKAKAIKQYKHLVYICATDARNLWERTCGRRWVPLKNAVITPTFIKKRGKPMDDDNAIGMLKCIDVLTMETARKEGADILTDDAPQYLSWGKPRWKKGQENKLILEVKAGKLQRRG